MFDRPIRLLLVEDNPGDALLFTETIKETRAFQFEVAMHSSGTGCRTLSASRPGEIVVRRAERTGCSVSAALGPAGHPR